MGYLTTLTIRNDALDAISDNPEQFTAGVVKLASDQSERYREFPVGNYGNPVEVQIPRHADDHTCYVHMGNCLVEMNPFMPTTKRIMKDNPEFFGRLLKFMESEVRELKRMMKSENVGSH